MYAISLINVYQKKLKLKKIVLLILVSLLIISCNEEVYLTFSEVNFTKNDNAIIEINIPNAEGTEEVSKAIGRGGHNIRLAGQLTGYEIDVFREGAEEDVELKEFSDEIEDWVISEFSKAGLDTAKSILEQDVVDLVKRTDLEEETIVEVIRILREEFEE